MRRTLIVLASGAAALLLASCGGGEKPHAAAGPPGSPQNPLMPKPTVTHAVHGRINEAPAAPSRVTKTTGKPRHAQGVSGTPAEGLVARPSESPCTLVTKEEAAAIVGMRIAKPLEAPQGPTCIYRPQRKGAMFVTLAVQDVGFKSLSKQMKRPQKVAVASKTAYCGVNGSPVLYLPLSGGRVLSVSAQCDVAKRFAATAVKRLGT